jgi:hypothetical protein
MSTEPQPEPAGTRVPDEGAQLQAACPSDPPDAPIDVSPGDQRAAAPWTQATDASGALRATREMPEPDSLGG